MKKGVCYFCGESEPGPLCEHCFLESIVDWLHEKGVGLDVLKSLTNNYDFSFSIRNPRANLCVLCRQNACTICPYCSFLKVSQLIREYSSLSPQMKNFLDDFDYCHFGAPTISLQVA
jgi:hypothetical protein